jgi:methionyl-tRNA formyltransferase
MRIVFFGNNRVGLETLRYLSERGDEIVGLVVHAPDRSRYRDEIMSVAGLPADQVWEAGALREPGIAEAIDGLNAEIGVSAFFGHILRSDILDLFPAGMINLHPAYLPYNRGAFTNVWSIVDGTPAGATLHYIDTGVDTGDVIARSRVTVSPTDTGGSLYDKLENACIELFKGTWPQVASGNVPRIAQSGPSFEGEGTSHRMKDVDAIDEIDLDASYKARDLINILRARTFPPYSGAYFTENDIRIYLRLQLLTEDELAGDGEGTEL